MAVIAIANLQSGVRWTNGRESGLAPHLGALLEQLDRPHAVLCEPPFYDNLRDVRRHLEEWLAGRGHRLVPVMPVAKATLEAAGGRAVTARGVERLFAIATIGSKRLGPITRDQDLMAVRAALQVAHVLDLFDEDATTFEEALRAAGPYGLLDSADQAALGDGRSYCEDVLIAAYRVASVATSKAAFDRLLGLTEASYGPLTQTVRNWYVERNTQTTFVRESVLAWTDYRRALRRLFHRFKEHRGRAAA